MKSDTRFILFDWLGHNNRLGYSIAICDVWERYSEALWNYFLQTSPGKPQNTPRSIRWRIRWSIIQQQAQQHKYLGLKEAKTSLNNSDQHPALQLCPLHCSSTCCIHPVWCYKTNAIISRPLPLGCQKRSGEIQQPEQTGLGLASP